MLTTCDNQIRYQSDRVILAAESILEGFFHADLEASDIGKQYIDNKTWSFFEFAPGNISAKPTGDCYTRLIYKFNPPACVKTVSFSFINDNDTEPYSFSVMDVIYTSKCK